MRVHPTDIPTIKNLLKHHRLQRNQVMAKTISIFNNKGGVGKSTISWNLAHSLGDAGKKILLIDFDPQCNLSLAVLGEERFVKTLPVQNVPYGNTIRSFLQRFLQNTGGEEVFLHKGEHTNPNVDLIAGDFWLNIYAESLNVGADLLTGTGLSRYVALKRIISKAEEKAGHEYDFAIIDLPPSFGALVRAAFCSSDYFIVPCTSDNFSVYCVGLIGQMVPNFIKDWDLGLDRFKSTNPEFTDFDNLGMPKFAGWAFNGFDTARERRIKDEIAQGAAVKDKRMHQADLTMHNRISEAIELDLVARLENTINKYDPIAIAGPQYRIGDIEDANVLAQNSLWLNVPIKELHKHQQVTVLRDRIKWAENQIEQMQLIGKKFDEMAENVITVCQ